MSFIRRFAAYLFTPSYSPMEWFLFVVLVVAFIELEFSVLVFMGGIFAVFFFCTLCANYLGLKAVRNQGDRK